MNVRTRWSRALLLIGTASVVAATSCGNSDNENSDTAPPSSPLASALSTISETADSVATPAAPDDGLVATYTSDGEVDPDGTARIAYHLTPTSLDPLGPSVHQVQSYLWPIYDGLLRLSPTLDVEPMLATEWSFTADGLGLNLKLRDDVVFHDGSRFDGETVKVNIERQLAANESPIRSFLANVTGVTVNSPYDVTINLSEPDASLPVVLAHRPGLMISPKAIAEGANLDETDGGSGPYRMASAAIGDRVTYERFDDYWGEPAGTKGLQIFGVNDGQARVNGVISGEFDMAYLTPSQLQQATNGGLDVVAQDTTWYIQLFQNRAHSNLDDLRVRRAVAHAIDRTAICAVIYAGECEPTSSILPQGYWAQDPSITPDYFRFDPDLARELLQDSGHVGQTISIAFPAASDPYPQFAELLQAQLNDVGFDVSVVPADINSLGDVYQVKQSVDMLLAGGGQHADPALMLANQFTSTATQNPSKMVPQGLDELVAEARAAVDPDDRRKVMHEVTRLIAEEVVDLPLVAPKVLFAIHPDRIASYTPTRLGAYLSPRSVTVHPG
jgi:ABC-type transport system substrate-binding protein